MCYGDDVIGCCCSVTPLQRAALSWSAAVLGLPYPIWLFPVNEAREQRMLGRVSCRRCEAVMVASGCLTWHTSCWHQVLLRCAANNSHTST